MIGAEIPNRAELAASLASSVRTLDGLVAVLQQRLTAARKLLRASEDPKSLDLLAARTTRARGQAASTVGLLAAGRLGVAMPEIIALAAEATTGIAHPQLREDIETMLDQLRAEGAKKLEITEALVALDTQIEQIKVRAVDLAETVTAMLQTILDGEAILDSNDNIATSAVQDVVAIVNLSGTQYAPGALQSRPPAGRRFEAVADQMMAAIDLFGLPHDGVQLHGRGDEAAARTRLIDGLTRNFDSHNRDGFRIFSRSVPQPAQRDTSGNSRPLRGRMLVNANLLRAEADEVLAALDRMPGLLRFAPTASRGLADARTRVRSALDQLVAIASDPMGVPIQRAEFQARRLLLAASHYLECSEIMTSCVRCADPDKSMDFVTMVDERLCLDEGAVRDDEGTVREEELRAEMSSLRALLKSLRNRVTSSNPERPRGRAAARLEEALTTAYNIAGMLEQELGRAGSSVTQQDVPLLVTDPGAAGYGAPGSTGSIGQFARWLRGVAEPFVFVDNYSAMLRRDELENLVEELYALAEAAKALQTPALNRRLGVGLPGPYRQLAELEGLIATAAERASTLTNSDKATAR